MRQLFGLLCIGLGIARFVMIGQHFPPGGFSGPSGPQLIARVVFAALALLLGINRLFSARPR